ncbi:helix-turn-helix domain-containing protein [Candidatus Pacearchaeota archaeon]|nr:helix-turn-helix domain-containing protein [Candidatus Pacearchaeota archaeon]
MWVLRLRLEAKNQFLGSLAVKHKVSMTGYPLSYYKDKNWLYLITAGFLFGDELNKKALLKEVRKEKELVNMEVNGDFVISITKQPLFTEPVYNPRIIRPNPVIIHKGGYHIWELASFDKVLLVKILDFAENKLGGKIISFKQEKVFNISFTKIIPELTKKQKLALEIAINKGYYNYPKGVKMEDLARTMKISYSTFQAHLKKAEGKIMPSIYKEI